ncbi:Uncharacterised protein [Kluyvera cryocrescens]|uniref:Uncharacterized protein n=1 Tax=Kluyvera cryocrescens TaxID=580 RepID=A0A485BSH3_KLUCR|nr:Uncharacterised protein [Kluyvera cryocrescens]
MSEVMVSEGIIESYWLLKDYWTRFDLPIKPKMVAGVILTLSPTILKRVTWLSPNQKYAALKKLSMPTTELTQDKYGSLLDYDGNNYFSFLKNLPRICSDGILFKNFSRMVDKITVQLVSNYVIDQDVMEDAKAAVLRAGEKHFAQNEV